MGVISGFKKHQPVDEADYIFEATVSSMSLSVGDMLELDVGATAWTVADSSTEYWQLKAIVTENITSSTKVTCMLVRPGVPYEAATTYDTDSAGNGDRMTLTSKSAVNNPESESDVTSQTLVCTQLKILGASTERRILVLIPGGCGVDPDA